MNLRRILVVRIVGFALVGLAFVSFGGRVLHEVLADRGSETYTSVKGFNVPYAAALVSVVVITSVALVVGIVYAWRYARRRSGVGRV